MLAGTLLVATLVAGACGDSGGDGVETPAAASAPAPAAEPAPPPPELQAPQQDELDEAAVVALAERIDAAQAGVASYLAESYATMRISSGGEPGLVISDVPMGTETRVGDLVRVEIGTAALFDTIMGALGFSGGPAAPDLPRFEYLLEGDSRVYMKLGWFVARDQMDPDPSLAELKAEHGDELGDMWGFVDLAESGLSPIEVLETVGLDQGLAAKSLGDDVAGLLALVLADGALLEARGGNRTQVAGADTTQYSFVFDLVALPEMQLLLGIRLGEDAGGGEASAGELPGPLPMRYTIYVDDDYFIRRDILDVDMGVIIAAVVEDLVRLGEIPEDKGADLLDVEFLISIRADTVALNDPSLTVTLPDPSLLVALPWPPDPPAPEAR